MSPSSLRRVLVVFLLVLAAAVTLAACGSSGSSSTSGSETTAEEPEASSEGSETTSEETETTSEESEGSGSEITLGEPTPPSDAAKELELVPKKYRPEYAGFWTFAKISPTPYAEYTPPEEPWQFCLNDSYQGNSWREQALQGYEKFVSGLAEQGLAKSGVPVTNSNGNVNLQASQLSQQVRQGCNAIVSFPASTSGMCSAIEEAAQQNVVVVTIDSAVDCKNVVNVAENDYTMGRETGLWLANALGGEGSVVLTEGIKGTAANTARMGGVNEAMEAAPGIEVVGTVVGEWTPSVTKAAMLKFLTTHPDEIDGFWDGGAMATASAEAFEQVGRTVPKFNVLSGDCSALAYWKEHEIESFGFSQGGGAAYSTAASVATELLMGAKPKITSMVFPLPEINDENLDEFWNSSMTVQSPCFSEPPDGLAVPVSYFEGLFEGFKEIPTS